MHPFRTAGVYGVSCGCQAGAGLQLTPEPRLEDEKTGTSLAHSSGLSGEFAPDLRLSVPEGTSGLEQTS